MNDFEDDEAEAEADAIYRPLRVKPGTSRKRVKRIVENFRARFEREAEARREGDRAMHLARLRRTNEAMDAGAIEQRAKLFAPRSLPEPAEVDEDRALAERLGINRQPRPHIEPRPAAFDAFTDDAGDEAQ